MSGPFDLSRFVTAQAPVLDDVRRELAAGQKRSHWMWFVFPQLAGLGHSPMARRYAIASLAEARAYAAHPVLGPLLIELTGLVNAAAGRTAREIFGSPDDMKFRSCMTLFDRAVPEEAAFRMALARYFGGTPDEQTVNWLARA